MTYPSGNTGGVPPQYRGGETFVPDPAYAGGGYLAAYGKGRHYDYAQLEKIWDDAGGDTALAPLMAAIAGNESGGDAGDWNSTGATGLWQIEYPGSSPPGVSREQLFIPEQNAAAAVALSRNSLAGIRANWAGDAALSGTGVLSGVPPAGTVPDAGKITTGATSISLGLNPLDWPAKIAQGAAASAFSGLLPSLQAFAVVAPVVLAGAAVGVLGLWQMTRGPRQRVEARTEQRAAEAAKIAAAL